MYDIEVTEEFENWLGNIQNSKTQKVIVKRIRTISLGSLGETRSLEGGLFEAKIRYGSGFRLYFVNRGTKTIVLLCGGDKSTQKQDIKRAREMAGEI
jgi:putative addiction module killer protein